MNPEHKKYISENAGKRSIKEIALELGLKERVVRRFLEKDKGEHPGTPDAKTVNQPAFLSYKNIPTIAVIILVLMLGIIIYANSFGNNFIFDDITHVQNNTAIRSLSNIPNIFTHHLTYFAGDKEGYFFRPIESFTFMVDYFFWKLKPFGYHITNTLLHIIVALLFFRIITFITKNKFLSAIIILLYLAHPMHTEAVAYISGRADSIATIFLLLMIILRYKSWSGPGYKITVYYILIFLSFLLALFTKESAVMFPLLLMLFEYCFRDEKKYTPLTGKSTLFYLSLFAVIGIWFLLRSGVVPTQKMVEIPVPMKDRFTFFGRLVYNYIGLCFFPFNLHMEYKIPFPKSIFQPYYFGPFIFIVIFLAFLFFLRQKGKLSTDYRIMFFGLGWFLIALLPYLNIFFLLNAPFSEHWVYIAQAGLILFCICALFYYVKNETARKTMLALCVIIILFFSYLTIKQNTVWKDDMTFYSYNIEKAPYSAKMYNNLAMEYMQQGDLHKAKELLTKAVKLSPNYTLAIENLKEVESALSGQN